MTYTLHLQNVTHHSYVPRSMHFKQWITAVLKQYCDKAEINVRIVNKKEMSTLNETYRSKKGPTNILSFPFEVPDKVPSYLLGDLIICAPIVSKEAKEQAKNLQAHWAHLVIHGVLHLLGYDHIKKSDASVMEKIEIETLAKLGYSNPY